MKKMSLLAASVALALTGCGSDSNNSGTTSNGDSSGSASGGNSSGKAPSGVVITAIDGYLQNAEVWVDTDGNFKLDPSDKKLNDKTDEEGQFILPNEYKDSVVFIKAIEDKTNDKTRGLVTDSFELATTAGSTIINPMTNMVIEQLEGAKAAGTELTREQAEAKVLQSVMASGLTVSKELLFGDYIADDSEQAQALNAIGETLVDYSDLTIEQQLELTEAVAVKAQAIIVDPSQKIDDFSPTVNVPADGNRITVTPNSRPVDSENVVLKDITLAPSDAWLDLDASTLFQDAEGDRLTFKLKELANDLNGLVIDSNTGIISGDLTKAGTYNYQIFAKDEHGALSYPLHLKVIKLAENLAPEVVDEEKVRLQSVIDGWQPQEGEVFNQTLDLSGLFNDADGDIVKYRSGALTVDGLTITPKEDTNSIVTISGTPSKSYPAGQTFNVGGVDDDNEPTYVTFTLPEVLEGYTPPETHPLEGKTWYYLEEGHSNGSDESGPSRVWCDTVLFKDGNVYQNKRTVENKTECTAEADIQIGTYSIKDDLLEAKYEVGDEGGIITYDVKNDYDSDAISNGSKAVVHTEDNKSSRYTWFKNELDAEKRIQVLSSDSSDVRDAAIYWPTSQEDKFTLTSTTLQMDVANGSGNSHDYIKVWMNGISCDGLFEGQDGDEAMFERFMVTFDDSPNGIYANNNSCFTVDEDGTPSAVISFLFNYDNNYRLEQDKTYSIMGYISDSWSEYITDIRFNMTWDGKSNHE
ncbi:hypothetical protein F7Q91_20720 [Vibrio chagasii]|uniref:Dystroglycan-type cadherin-like domain-containing protein n=1 Tax=Vibrio chagasii TaxID=170679 RepID=A0A7V7NQQ4_9VIBR|nr:Ig domain-containing protein [Vibrio chagasii]KAB0475066.1 hypothetical protein F7Q91_20720 [Vibrio chagasii]